LKADDLLKGAIDLHVHGYPEVSFDVHTRVGDYEIASLAVVAGMKGFVLKSHIWPTVGRVYHLRKSFENLKIFPSITLNSTVGGFNPIAVENAAKQGAKIVFMPTWSASNDLQRKGFSSYMKRYLKSARSVDIKRGLSFFDSEGHLRSDVKEVLRVAKTYKLVVAIAHISPAESLAVVVEANQIGLWPVIFSHPDSHSVGGTINDMQAMAKKGAYIEFCSLGLLPMFQRIHPRELIENIKEIGTEQCFISTDFFFNWPPPPTEMLRMTVATLLDLGLGPEEIELLVRINPSKILRMKE
jgi:hypothetical protein